MGVYCGNTNYHSTWLQFLVSGRHRRSESRRSTVTSAEDLPYPLLYLLPIGVGHPVLLCTTCAGPASPTSAHTALVKPWRVVPHEHRGERGAETAAAGVELLWSGHSMIWSARASSDGGIVRPRALAVLRLMINSNFVGCSTGRSPGFAPLRILSTKYAARRYISRMFGP
jgi:hypothetical protein